MGTTKMMQTHKGIRYFMDVAHAYRYSVTSPCVDALSCISQLIGKHKREWTDLEAKFRKASDSNLEWFESAPAMLDDLIECINRLLREAQHVQFVKEAANQKRLGVSYVYKTETNFRFLWASTIDKMCKVLWKSVENEKVVRKMIRESRTA